MVQLVSSASVGDCLSFGAHLCYSTLNHVIVYGNDYCSVALGSIRPTMQLIIPSQMAGFISALQVNFATDVQFCTPYWAPSEKFGRHTCYNLLLETNVEGFDGSILGTPAIANLKSILSFNKSITSPVVYQCNFSGLESFVIHASCGSILSISTNVNVKGSWFIYPSAIEVPLYYGTGKLLYNMNEYKFEVDIDSKMVLKLIFGDNLNVTVSVKSNDLASFGVGTVFNIVKDCRVNGNDFCVFGNNKVSLVQLIEIIFDVNVRNYVNVALQVMFRHGRVMIVDGVDMSVFSVPIVYKNIITCLGFDSCEISDNGIRRDGEYPVKGVNMLLIGKPLCVNKVDVAGISFSMFGAHGILYDGSCVVHGFDSVVYGAASVIRFDTSSLIVNGFDSLQISDVVIDAHESVKPDSTYIYVEPLNGYISGGAWVSHYIRNCLMYPSSSMLVFGSKWVSYYKRFLNVQGMLYFVSGVTNIFYKGQERILEQVNSSDFAVYGLADVNVQRAYLIGTTHTQLGLGLYVFTNKLVASGSAFTLYGRPRVWLRLQYANVTYDCTDLAVRCGVMFGSRVWVFNRNRYLYVAGYPMLQFASTVADVIPGARVANMFSYDGFISGNGLVDFGVRYIYSIGQDFFRFNANRTYIYNAARVLNAHGVRFDVYGAAWVERLLRFIRPWPLPSQWVAGVAWVEFGARELGVLTNRFDNFVAGRCVVRFADVLVNGLDSYVSSAPVVEKLPYRTIIPRWNGIAWNESRYGLSYIYNKNKIIKVLAFIPTEYGLQRIFNLWQFVRFFGLDSFISRWQNVTFKNRSIYGIGFGGHRIGHCYIYNWNQWIPPVLPYTQFCYVDGFYNDMLKFGNYFVRSNVLFVQGFNSFESPRFKIPISTIRVLREGYPDAIHGFMMFGRPTFTHYVRYITVHDRYTKMPPGINWYVAPMADDNEPTTSVLYMTEFGLPMLSPFTIYVSVGNDTDQWKLIWEFVHKYKLYPCTPCPSGANDVRHFRVCVGPHYGDYPCWRGFGRANVRGPIVYDDVVVNGFVATSIGEPTITLFNRPVYMSGRNMFAPGYPIMYGPTVRYRDIEGSIMTLWGNVFVHERTNRLLVSGNNMLQFGVVYVDQKPKTIYMISSALSLYGKCGVYYNPRPVYILALLASIYGETWIDYAIRYLYSYGDTFDEYPSWIRDSMRVYNKNRIIRQSTWTAFSLYGKPTVT